MSKFFIYGLFDPRNGQLRYVGKSSKGLLRPRQHGQGYFLRKAPHTRVSRWVTGLQAEGLSYEIVVLEEQAGPEGLSEAECFWIASMRALGCDLTNLTSGGDGRRGPCTWGDKIAAAARGKRATAETKQKMSAAHLGKASPNRGKSWSAEYRAKMTAAHGIRPFVDQYGIRYESCHDAARKLGTSAGSVSRALHGKQKSSRGRTFKFVE